MSVLVIETQALVPIGAFGPPLHDAGLELVYWRTGEDAPPSLAGVAGVIALGGVANPDQDERYPWLAVERKLLAEALDRRLPTLGLCLGAQLLAQVLGGSTWRLPQPEIGWFELERAQAAARDALAGALPRRFDVFQWHSYAFDLPPGATCIAGNEEATHAFSWAGCAWGLQFHAEADERIIGDWITHYEAALYERQRDPRNLALETRRRAPAYLRQANALARAFATTVKRSLDSPLEIAQ